MRFKCRCSASLYMILARFEISSRTFTFTSFCFFIKMSKVLITRKCFIVNSRQKNTCPVSNLVVFSSWSICSYVKLNPKRTKQIFSPKKKKKKEKAHNLYIYIENFHFSAPLIIRQISFEGLNYQFHNILLLNYRNSPIYAFQEDPIK